MHNKEKKLSPCNPPCPQLFNYILLELNMSIHLAHVGKFLESAGFIERYPLSYTRGGRSVAWTGFIVTDPTSQLYAFVFDIMLCMIMQAYIIWETQVTSHTRVGPLIETGAHQMRAPSPCAPTPVIPQNRPSCPHLRI